jgi:hypothetical protein
LTRRLLRAIVIALILLLALCFPFGPLFPWSPWKPGYTSVAFDRATIYYPAGGRLPGAFLDLDRDIEESEQFHRQLVPKPIRVILCRNWSDFHRFMPGTGRVGAVTLDTGTVIYVAPRVAERGLDYAEFLRHEISHATVNQHQSLREAHANSKAPWLFEGLAVSFGRQKAYATLQEFKAFVMARDLVPVIDPEKHRPDVPSDMRLNYQVWRYFLEYLIETRGRDKFQNLLLEAMRDPASSGRAFQSVYSVSMPDEIRRFRADVLAGRWTARP